MEKFIMGTFICNAIWYYVHKRDSIYKSSYQASSNNDLRAMLTFLQSRWFRQSFMSIDFLRKRLL